MAAIVRSHAARICSVSWKLVSRSGQAVAGVPRGNNSSSLCRLIVTSQQLQRHSFSTRIPYSDTQFLGKNVTSNAVQTSILKRSLLQVLSPTTVSSRSKVYFSKKKGKPKTVHSVVKRFYRLNWGIWIRTRAGRQKKLWKKSERRKYRLRQHVFCNKQQSKLLDKMTTEYWKKPRYFVDDPYAPYQKRTNFPLYFAEQKRPFYP